MRFCGFQNITINLPQASYRAGKGNWDALYEEIDKGIEIAVKAHLQKKKFAEKLMSSPEMPPLGDRQEGQGWPSLCGSGGIDIYCRYLRS